MSTSVKFVYDDGGRSKSSHPNERLDCSVRALSIAFNNRYDWAHATIKAYGRKDRCRIKNHFAFTAILGDRPIKRSGTIEKFVREHPEGTYIIWTAGHFFNLTNGTIYDLFLPNQKKRVKAAWRVV